jgi:hypothetical protein
VRRSAVRAATTRETRARPCRDRKIGGSVEERDGVDDAHLAARLADPLDLDRDISRSARSMS